MVIVPFDNVLDTDAVMQVNEDQLEMGRKWAQFLVDELKAQGKDGGKILEVRGLPGNSVDRDRSIGIHEVFDATGGDWEIVQVVGNWDDGTAQKVTADAIAVHGQFDGVTVQGGSTGTVQAMMDAGHPFVPVAGESENGFRKLIAEHSDEGLKGISIGQSPGLVAISMKAAISALEGNPMPQLISVPLPVADHTDAEGRRELLVRPARQLLHRQRVPALRREHLRPRDHGAVRSRHVSIAAGGPVPPADPAHVQRPSPTSSSPASRSTSPASAPSKASTSPAAAARSTPCSARTAPASRR